MEQTLKQQSETREQRAKAILQIAEPQVLDEFTYLVPSQNFRGFHGSVSSAHAIMKGLSVFYNFVRKHEALKGKTPSDMAIPSLQFQTPNRWLELIELSNNNNLK